MLVKKPPKYSLFGLVIYLMSFTLHAGNYWEGISEAGNEHKLANVDIRFYGKVVDQHGQPIEGAKIDFYVLANNENLISDILIHGTENTRLTTKSTREIYSDGTGSFSITDLRGTSAAVEDIYKEGYFSQKGNSFSFRDGAPEALTQATEQHPAVFVLWKRGESQALIKTEVRMILEPSEHNKPITIHLVEYPNNPGYAEEGDFRITVYNQGRGSDEKDRPLRKKYDWWVKLESVDGGLLSTNDTWLYEAPSSGYQNSLRMEEKGSAPDWKRSIEEKKIYFKTHGNYGSANIRIITHVNGSIGVYMKDLFINPTGSRNLEYDQYKRIQVKHNFK